MNTIPAVHDTGQAPQFLDDRAVQAVLTAFPVPFLVCDAESGQVVEANTAAAELLGSGTLVGTSITDHLVDRTEPLDRDADGRTLRRSDGHLVHVDCVVTEAVVSGRRFWLWAMRDVSARVTAEQARDQATHDLLRSQMLFRREIAERLHDGPVQVLTAAALRLGLLRLLVDDELAGEVAEIEQLVSRSLREVRGEMEDLRPPISGGDLASALEDLLGRMGVEHRYVVRIAPTAPTESVSTLLLKVVQHLLAIDLDVETDGPPTPIEVDTGGSATTLRLRVRGDGQLPERLASWAMALHATINRTSDPSGTTFSLTVPTPPAASARSTI